MIPIHKGLPLYFYLLSIISFVLNIGNDMKMNIDLYVANGQFPVFMFVPHEQNNKQLLRSGTYNYHGIFIIVLADLRNHFIWWNGVSEIRCVRT
jgi:hypothetical protein